MLTIAFILFTLGVLTSFVLSCRRIPSASKRNAARAAVVARLACFETADDIATDFTSIVDDIEYPDETDDQVDVEYLREIQSDTETEIEFEAEMEPDAFAAADSERQAMQEAA